MIQLSALYPQIHFKSSQASPPVFQTICCCCKAKSFSLRTMDEGGSIHYFPWRDYSLSNIRPRFPSFPRPPFEPTAFHPRKKVRGYLHRLFNSSPSFSIVPSPFPLTNPYVYASTHVFLFSSCLFSSLLSLIHHTSTYEKQDTERRTSEQDECS